ncbi:MAG: NAD(+)/NADH kinase [Rickettsiales bacterium]|jgi:NAD+ kinase|nr:NAD(+)/NADH kinase [Rickettsiales bacterium]
MRFAIVCTRPSPSTEKVKEMLARSHYIIDVSDCDGRGGVDALVVLGGDGSMLRAIHDFHRWGLPFYGINCGGVGFLLNEFRESDNMADLFSGQGILLEINPLVARLVDRAGLEHSDFSVNELCLARSLFRPCTMDVRINSRERISGYRGDGILVSTALGSTAYNSSVGGVVIPPSLNCLSLAAISPDRRCPFRSALVRDDSVFEFYVNEPDLRSVNAFLDGREYKNVCYAKLQLDRGQKIRLLFNGRLALEEKVLARQFPGSEARETPPDRRES